MRIRALLTSAALVASAGALVAATDTTASAAASNAITSVSPKKPIVSETFAINGRLSTPVERPVQLQRKTKSGWKKVLSTSTKSDGKFRFETSTTGTKVYRVFAQKVTIGETTYGSRTTAKRTVTPVAQKVVLELSRSTVKSGQTVTLTISNRPVRQGRPVGLRGSFTLPNGQKEDFPANVVGEQNSKGGYRDSFTFEGQLPKGVLRYQAVALPHDGAPAKYSKVVKLTIK